MSRKGNCCDNAPVESFFGSLKNEFVRHQYFQHQAEACYAIAEYIERFITASTCIRHWAIGAQKSSRRWPVSLNPGVRYFLATSH